MSIATVPVTGHAANGQPDDDDDLVIEDDDDDDVGVDESPAENELTAAEVEANTNLARQLFFAGESAYKRGQYKLALDKYRAGYRLLPTRHGFAFKIGQSAWQLRDCVTAREFLTLFLQRAAGLSKFADRIPNARSILSKIRASGCADSQPSASVPDATDEDDDLSDDEYVENEERGRRAPRVAMARDAEDPFGSSARDRRRARSRRNRTADKANASGLLATGITFMTLGAGAAGTGLAFNILAHNAANELIDLANRDPITKFPAGDYACRDRDDPCPKLIQRDLEAYNIVTPIAYATGGAMFAVGIILVAVRQSAAKKLKNGGKANSALRRPKVRLTAFEPSLSPRMLGARARIRF